jgi:putative endonuclease
MARAPCVYIMASKRNGTLYTGVTSNLAQRAYHHRESLTPGFASRYGCKLLVWYETHERMDDAIGSEKQIKGGSRATKDRADPGDESRVERSLREPRLKSERRHCEERSDEAIPLPRPARRHGLLRLRLAMTELRH